MLYSNIEFFLLVMATLLLFLVFRAQRSFRQFTLLGASLVFYAWTGLFHTAIFLFVVIISWLFAFFANRYPKFRNELLFSGIAVMALHLFSWKYASWISVEINFLFPSVPVLHLPLPVGISFFTLQGIAYLIDIYRGEAALLTFREYLLFKSFFAQLIAGPIVRYHEVAGQLKELKSPKSRDIFLGTSMLISGLFKKIVVSERIGAVVDNVFANPQIYNRTALILAVVGYSVQIWSDFSGYTDMGIGSARILGIKLPQNFLSPYFSLTPSEFWRRWHITLSQWIRDYIYIPLGGNKGSPLKVASVVFLTMAISGAWHGASFTFIAWGLFHGLLLTLEQGMKRLKVYALSSQFIGALGSDLFAWSLTTTGVLFGWLLFRAQTWADLGRYLDSYSSSQGQNSLSSTATIFILTGFCFFYQWIGYFDFQKKRYVRWEKITKTTTNYLTLAPGLLPITSGLAIGFLFLATLFFRNTGVASPFIYFQF